jgi:hypothetical protein
MYELKGAQKRLLSFSKFMIRLAMDVTGLSAGQKLCNPRDDFLTEFTCPSRISNAL